jgi:hypothetical protein
MRKGKKLIIVLVSIILFLKAAGIANASNLILIPNNIPKACNCTGAPLVNKCGQTYYGLTNIKYQICTWPAGQDTCNYYRTKQDGSNDVYKVVNCASGGTPTPTPTGSTTGTPTPTINVACVCNTAGACSSQCQSQFSKYPVTVITTYNNPIKCGVAATFFKTTPVAGNKNDWCRRPQKTKGDSDGNDKVNLLDYFYYVQAKSGGKIPARINPDFNGDNAINNEDRVIILKTL